MASSKNLLILLRVLFTIKLLISSEVEATEESMKTNDLEDGDGGYNHKGHGGHGHGGGYKGKRRCHYGCCRVYRYKPGCVRRCGSANEAPDAQFEDDLKN